MSSAEIPTNDFMAEPPSSRSAIAKGTIHLTHCSTSTLFRAARMERSYKESNLKRLERRDVTLNDKFCHDDSNLPDTLSTSSRDEKWKSAEAAKTPLENSRHRTSSMDKSNNWRKEIRKKDTLGLASNKGLRLEKNCHITGTSKKQISPFASVAAFVKKLFLGLFTFLKTT